MQMQVDAYEEQFEQLHDESNKIKNQNLYLETHMHELRLEHERQNRLYSSSFFHLGLIQVKKDKMANKVAAGGTDKVYEHVDWLDSQKDNVYAHSYDMIFRQP